VATKPFANHGHVLNGHVRYLLPDVSEGANAPSGRVEGRNAASVTGGRRVRVTNGAPVSTAAPASAANLRAWISG